MKQLNFSGFSLPILSLALCTITATTQAQLQLDWIDQWGTNESEFGIDVAIDGAGNPYLAGNLGTLALQEETHDVFVRRYLDDGTFDWFAQVGTGAPAGGGKDTLSGLAVDSEGNAYLTGRTLDGRGVSGAVQGGREGAFAVRVNANGSIGWTDQIDNTNNTGFERAFDVALDNAGNPRFAGISQNGLDGNSPDGLPRYLRQYSPAGAMQSTTTFADLNGQAIAVDSANTTFVAGSIGNFTVPSLARLNTDGSVAWTRQLGDASTIGQINNVVVGVNGSVYVVGSVSGDLAGTSAGSNDVFVARYTADGTLEWVRQFGTSSFDTAGAIDIDALGNIYVAGQTDGDLTGEDKGSTDFFITQFSGDGSQNWTLQDGTDQFDAITGLAVDNQGNLYVSGYTNGDLDGASAGGFDAFVIKYNFVPEPSSLSAFGVMLVCLRRRR